MSRKEEEQRIERTATIQCTTADIETVRVIARPHWKTKRSIDASRRGGNDTFERANRDLIHQHVSNTSTSKAKRPTRKGNSTWIRELGVRV